MQRFGNKLFLREVLHVAVCCLVAASSETETEYPEYPPKFLRSLTEDWGPCDGVGEECLCQGSAANCTDRYNLTSIPRFDENITTLLIYMNKSLGDYSSFQVNFFDNVTSIVELYINGTFYFDGTARALQSLLNLRVLCLETVQVKNFRLEVVQTITSLQEIYFSSVNMWSSKQLLPQKKTKSELHTLYIREGNPNPQWPMNLYFETFQPLTKLKTVFIEDTLIRFQEFVFALLPPLERLGLRGIALAKFPDACDRYGNAFFPKLSHLLLDRNNIRTIPGFVCCDNVTHLSLQKNNLRGITGDEFSDELFPKLEYLSLKQAGQVSKIPAKAFPNPSLQTLDLSDNKLNFASDSVSEALFDSCTNLSVIDLEGNDFQSIDSIKFGRMFAKLTKLLELSLSSTQFSQLKKTLFTHMTSMAELDLSSNKLSDIPDGVFDDLDKLTVLKLDNNAITTISQSTFPHRLQSLNLSDNPFECTCSLLSFRKWLVSNPGLFDLHNPYSRYDCHNIQGMALADWAMNKQECLLSHETYVLTVVCVAVLICTLSVAILLYRYRWHLRLALYEAFRGSRQAGWTRFPPENFKYDLFVCYDSEDEAWVLQELMPELEGRAGLRLCVHKRDFIPGKNITNNILDSLQASKRVLVTFSPSFAESQWCNFELEMCLSHVIDNHDVMVLVMLRHVPSRDMSGAMLALLKTTTYIEWGDGADARESFWRRLTLAVTDILPV